MIVPENILEQINFLTVLLIEKSYSAKQNFSSINKHLNDKTVVSWAKTNKLSETFDKKLSYREVYDICRDRKYYNLVLVDGAIIQFYYEFQSTTLLNHRVAFLPSPYLEEFQNQPDLYVDDLIYAEVINRSIVPSPLRFDYDKKSFKEVEHPQSHLTIGQYQNCRIPVKSAITPFQFINFIFNNFYNNTLVNTEIFNKCNDIYFGDSITKIESSLVHLNFEV